MILYVHFYFVISLKGLLLLNLKKCMNSRISVHVWHSKLPFLFGALFAATWRVWKKNRYKFKRHLQYYLTSKQTRWSVTLSIFIKCSSIGFGSFSCGLKQRCCAVTVTHKVKNTTWKTPLASKDRKFTLLLSISLASVVALSVWTWASKGVMKKKCNRTLVNNLLLDNLLNHREKKICKPPSPHDEPGDFSWSYHLHPFF